MNHARVLQDARVHHVCETQARVQDALAEDEAFQKEIEEGARMLAVRMEQAMLLLQRAARGFLVRRSVGRVRVCVCDCSP